MNNIIGFIESYKRKRFTGGVSAELIKNAENKLGLELAHEYKEVLLKYGSLYIKGEEFLGIDCDNYDLVKATIESRNEDNAFPRDAYVIENIAIDGILIIQKKTGELMFYQPNCKLQHIANSLEEYLLNL